MRQLFSLNSLLSFLLIFDARVEAEILTQSVSRFPPYTIPSYGPHDGIGHSLLSFTQLVQQRTSGNQLPQCPCVHLPGSDKCITYDSRYMAVSIEEAMLTFADQTMDPHIHEQHTGDPITPASFACVSPECRQCVGILAARLRQSGLLRRQLTFSFQVPTGDQIELDGCPRIRLSRRINTTVPDKQQPSWSVDAVAAAASLRKEFEIRPKSLFARMVEQTIIETRAAGEKPQIASVLRSAGVHSANLANNVTAFFEQNSRRTESSIATADPPADKTFPKNNSPDGQSGRSSNCDIDKTLIDDSTENCKNSAGNDGAEDLSSKNQGLFNNARIDGESSNKGVQKSQGRTGQSPQLESKPNEQLISNSHPRNPQPPQSSNAQQPPQQPVSSNPDQAGRFRQALGGGNRFENQNQQVIDRIPPEFPYKWNSPQPNQNVPPQPSWNVPQQPQWNMPPPPQWNMPLQPWMNPQLQFQQVNQQPRFEARPLTPTNIFDSGPESAPNPTNFDPPNKPPPRGSQGFHDRGNHQNPDFDGEDAWALVERTNPSVIEDLVGHRHSMRRSPRSEPVLSSRVRRQAPPHEKVIGERFVISCVEKGDAETETTDFINLCTVCWTWRQLPENYFPRLLNELVCQEDDYCLSGWGTCSQRYRNVDILQKRGRNWIPTTISLATCCDCKVHAGSDAHSLVIGGKK